MHKMPIPDDRFDIVYSCHSLQLSYDPKMVLGEFYRVVKHGGVIFVDAPVGFDPTATTISDVASTQKLLSLMPEHGTDRVLYREDRTAPPYLAKIMFSITKK